MSREETRREEKRKEEKIFLVIGGRFRFDCYSGDGKRPTALDVHGKLSCALPGVCSSPKRERGVRGERGTVSSLCLADT